MVVKLYQFLVSQWRVGDTFYATRYQSASALFGSPHSQTLEPQTVEWGARCVEKQRWLSKPPALTGASVVFLQIVRIFFRLLFGAAHKLLIRRSHTDSFEILLV